MIKKISLLFNLIFIVLIGYFFLKKGGLEYVKTRLEIDNTKPDWYYKYFEQWKQTRDMYQILPNTENEIIFVGTSLTYGCNWSELFQNKNIKNRGISGDNTEGVLERLHEITESKPDKIFIEIGTNDLGLGMKTEQIIKNYKKILHQIKTQSSSTKIFIQSVLPVNYQNDRTNNSVIALNTELEQLAKTENVTFINLYKEFVDTNNNFKETLFYDGLHVNSKGYNVWKQCLEKYVINFN